MAGTGKKARKKASSKAVPVKNNRSMLTLVVVAVLVLAAAGAIWALMKQDDVAASGRLPREISVADAHAKREAGAFMLDVREVFEWEEYHMEGATLIPQGDLLVRLDELPKDQEIVVVCRSGNRSADARDRLLANGFSSVTSMAGGMVDWRAAGYPVVSGP
jgi:rhodanese-related sulfurtransferase